MCINGSLRELYCLMGMQIMEWQVEVKILFFYKITKGFYEKNMTSGEERFTFEHEML